MDFYTIFGCFSENLTKSSRMNGKVIGERKRGREREGERERDKDKPRERLRKTKRQR